MQYELEKYVFIYSLFNCSAVPLHSHKNKLLYIKITGEKPAFVSFYKNE